MTWHTDPKWTAGPTWVSSKGKLTFHIRQTRGGRPYSYSTRTGNLKTAFKELERFEANPAEYRPAGSEEVLALTDALVARYVSWCELAEKPPCKQHLRAKERHLNWWKVQLAGRDLKTVKLSRIIDALVGQPDRAKRIVAIKHLYTWLRETDQLALADDPTAKALKVPQAKVAQDGQGGSKEIPEADFLAVLPLLPEVIADGCRLMAATGCHLSEVIRFAATGTVDGNVVGFAHKNGHTHRLAVSQGIVDAAKRLKKAKLPSLNVWYRKIGKACDDAKVTPWTPGRFRATFATRAVTRGENPQAVALALGHRSAATTLTWYATTAVAPAMAGMEVP